MCTYWNELKSKLKRRTVLYKTRFNNPYKLDGFVINRFGEEVLRYSIPKRNDIGLNYKSIPSDVFCRAKNDFKKGKLIDISWLKDNFERTYKAGGCNLKVLQAILSKN